MREPVMEQVTHSLAFAVVVTDAFTDAPVREELSVELDTGERPGLAAGGAGTRNADGTYRFIDLGPGPRQIAVTSPSGAGFTWTATTPVTVPIAPPSDRRNAIAIVMWPTPRASAPPGTIAIRGILGGPIAGQEVQITPVFTPPPPPPLPPPRRSRSDADGEFLFVVAGATQIDPSNGLVPLAVAVPGHGVTGIDVIVGVTTTSYAGPTFWVPPGRETRVRFHLS